MGQGTEAKTRPEPAVEIQEKGEVFFFYRPKVNRDEAHSPDDVQRLFVVLRPESAPGRDTPVELKQAPESGKEGNKRRKTDDDDDKKAPEGGHGQEEVTVEEAALLRLIVMGKKSLPDPGKKKEEKERGRPSWGYVDLVTTSIEDVKDALSGEDYETKTRGKRHRPEARALGEGVYRILKHHHGHGAHTHLVYKLEHPCSKDEGGPQEAMNVDPEASFVLQIKNPEHKSDGGFAGLQGKRRAEFPEGLRGRFAGNRYAPADPPDLLNYEGCELLLVPASDDVEAELGLELHTETEGGARCSDLVKMFGDVAHVKPLLSSTWD